jgi:hypothetical protein
MTMKLMSVKVAAAALSLAFAGPLFAADSGAKDQYKAEKERIEQEAKADKDKVQQPEGERQGHLHGGSTREGKSGQGRADR